MPIGAHLLHGIGTGLSPNNESYIAYSNMGSSGSSNNYGSAGLFGQDDIITWWPNGHACSGGCGTPPPNTHFVNGDLGAKQIVGFSQGNTPGISFAAGTGSVNAGSTAIAGTIASTFTGTSTFTLTWAYGYAYLHRAVCTFTDETTHANIIASSSATTTTLTASGPTTSGDVISYSCVGY